MCFAQTAALRGVGRALSEKRKGHEGVDGDVYQAQVIHNAFPTVSYMFLNNCKAFLGDEHRKSEHWRSTGGLDAGGVWGAGAVLVSGPKPSRT